MLRFAPLVGVFAAQALLADSFSFEFNVHGVLPSAQGATYEAANNVAEIAAYSVSGGLLHQNTVALAANARVAYSIASILDHSTDATLEWGIQVWSSTNVGLQLFLGVSGQTWNFVLRDNAVMQHNGSSFVPVVSMNTTDAIHAYRVFIPAKHRILTFTLMGSSDTLEPQRRSQRPLSVGRRNSIRRQRQSRLGLYPAQQRNRGS